MRIRTVAILFILGFRMGLMPGLNARERQSANVHPSEDFFIISSVNVTKQQIVLKRPTEVTDLVSVNAQTVFLDEEGKRLQLKDLRAGDTVYVTLASNPRGGPHIVQRIRKGIMTVEGLRRSYLTFQ